MPSGFTGYAAAGFKPDFRVIEILRLCKAQWYLFSSTVSRFNKTKISICLARNDVEAHFRLDELSVVTTLLAGLEVTRRELRQSHNPHQPTASSRRPRGHGGRYSASSQATGRAG